MTRLSGRHLKRLLPKEESIFAVPVSVLKYSNEKTTADGEVFDSKWEKRVWRDLKLRQEAGEISDLKRQVPFELQPAYTDKAGTRHRPIVYVADFTFTEYGQNDQFYMVAADAKGYATREFRIKAKLFQYRYPAIELRVIKA